MPTGFFRRLARQAVTIVRWEGVILLAALGFGTVSTLATRWFILFAVVAAAFLCLAWLWAAGDSPAGERFRHRARTVGIWVWAALLVLIGLAIFWRFSRWWGAAIFAASYLVLGCWHILWLSRRRTNSIAQFRLVIALSVLPVLLAWIVNSTVYQIYVGAVSRAALTGDETDAWSERLAMRREYLETTAGTVAVSLSGGGYRAAAVHAGILSVLDQAGLPVEYLSTVSGGSIVGASYAMGMSAEEFRDHLKDGKPGLPNDLINFYPVFAQLFVPGYGSGDTYANHFKRAFYRERRLDQTGPPLLILNATRYRDGTRRAFVAGSDSRYSLGRLVAASGAFPVAFDPVTIDGESYIDGGVVENLGIGGLQQYFSAHAADGDIAQRLPDVLIISDAGLIPEAPPSWNKPSLLQMAVRAQQTSYFAMHRWIYSFYTDGAYDRAGSGPIMQPFEVTAGRLWPDLPPQLHARTVKVFVFSPSSPGERVRYAGHEALLDAVSELDTLKELDPDEVDAAFWIGAHLAEAYVPALCTATGIRCRTVAVADAPPNPD